MKLLIHSLKRSIHDASNAGAWQVPPGFEIVDVPGDAETFVWPNGHPARCLLDMQNTIVSNPAWTPPPPNPLKAKIDAAVGGLIPQTLKDLLIAWKSQL